VNHVFTQMIAKREEARRLREEEKIQDSHPLDELVQLVEMEQQKKSHPSLQWKGSFVPPSANDNIYSKRQKRVEAQRRNKVPKLYSLCVDYLVQNFEYVESLGNVDATIRRDICSGLVAINKLNSEAFDSLAEAGTESLDIIDCADITEEQLSKTLRKLLPFGLRFLVLHHSGRCFGPVAVKTISSVASKLFAISIAGAYLLSDHDSRLLLDSCAAHLSSLEFKACPNLGVEFCNAITENYSSLMGRGTLLELSIESLCLTKEDLLSLGASDALRNLKGLSLRCMEAVDDEVVSTILERLGDDLEDLDLSYCSLISDNSLSGVRTCNKGGALRSLRLNGLKHLTALGLEALFTPIIPGLPGPPMLRNIDFGDCAFHAVNDAIMELASQASSMKRDNIGGMSQYRSSTGGLISVNIKGSSCTDITMETLATTSASTLKELNVSFSPGITNQGLGYLVSQAGFQLTKIQIWGCAQISDEFLDGHHRTNDPKFQVIGAWIKKGNLMSTR
jgi:hypothetical protein